MKEDLQNWLSDKSAIHGLLAGGIVHPDQTTFTHLFDPSFDPATADSIWPIVAPALLAIRTQKLPEAHIQWIFEQYTLHCAIRTEGRLLALLCQRPLPDEDVEVLKLMLNEFRNL
jgi:hypothetical protein